MKHNPSKLLSLLFAVPFVCMCSKENSNEPASKGEQITITATMSDTKVDLTQGQEELLLTWSEGDALMVIGNTAEKYDIVDDGSGIGTRTATFLGTSVEGEEFTVYYPGTYATVEALTARSYESQVQTGNGNLEHLEYNSLAQGLSDFRVVNFGADGVLNNGVLKLVVKLPEAVTEVSSISISAPEEIFYTTNGTEEKTRTLSLGFENCVIGNDHILTAYMMTSWQDVTIESGTKLTIDVTVPDRLCRYTKTMSKKEDIALNGGACLNIDISNATTLDHVLSGSGTEADPYLLYNEEDLLCIRPILENNLEVHQYFKMEKDINMSSIDDKWVPLNDANIKNGDKQFCGYIHFDGNNKTISNLKCTSKAYTSFFGILIGSVKNLTFDQAEISSDTNSGCGVIGGYIGTYDGRYGKAENVTIKNSNVSYSGGGANCAIAFGNAGEADISGITVQKSTLTFEVKENQQYIGAILGGSTANKCNISNCSCDTEVQIINKNVIKGIGGIAGNIGHIGGEVMDNCSFRGSITPGNATQQYVGGIVGMVWMSGSDYSTTLKNCYNYATINAPNCTIIGGITGYMQKGSIENCHNYGDVTGNGVQGGIVGRCERNVEISGCTNSGIITSAGAYAGGIVGYKKLQAEINDCHNFNKINSQNNYVGGIAGYNVGIIDGCSNEADVVTTSGRFIGGIVGYQEGNVSGCHNIGFVSSQSNTYIGGIVAHLKTGNVEKCYNTGKIKSSNNYTGGIVGFLEAGNADQCFNRGPIEGGSYTGGIIGVMSATASTTEYTVSNCYSSADISCSESNSYCGGILGDARRKITFKSLYSTGSITGGIALGGIIGRMSNSSNNAAGQNYNNLLYYCISYVSSIDAKGSAATDLSSGAIVGFAGTKLASSYCYRRAVLQFNCTAKPDNVDAPFDQGRSISSSTGVTTGVAAPAWYPYHGNAVTASFTGVSSVVNFINGKITNAWDETIWDLSGEHPTLKNNPEPAAE